MYRECDNKDDAFAELVNLWKPIIINKLKKVDYYLNDIDDLYQEVLIKLYLVIDRYDTQQDKPFEYYVNCVIRSVKYDYLRKQYAYHKRIQSMIKESHVNVYYNQHVNPVEIKMLQRADLMNIFEHTKYFTKVEKRVFYALIAGYKPLEIARILKLQRKAVYNSIQRCKMKLYKVILKTTE